MGKNISKKRLTIEEANIVIEKEKQKREQEAMAELNTLLDNWSKKHNCQLSISQPQLQVVAR